jgi:tRNA (guanine9-N1)-methyltransferase
MLEAHQNGTRLVIDLQWYGLMKSTEAKSAVQQIVHSYSVNAHCAAPFQLWLSSYREEYFAHLSGRNGWKLHRTEASVLDHFLSEKDRLVYLSADAEEDLTNIDKDAIYIIGGFVDRNRHKGITDTWAKEHGIRTVRFPISNLSVVLTINQVVAIMCEVNSDGDWQRALDVAVPKRKVLAQGEDHIAASQTLQSDVIHGSDVEDGVNDILDNDSDSLSGSEL